MLSPRELFPDLLPNLRDLGGMTTKDSRVLRRRQLLRSAALVHTAEAAADVVTAHVGPATYADLRTDVEVERDGEPRALLDRGWTWRRVPIQDKRKDDTGNNPDDLLSRYRVHLPLYAAAAAQVASSLRRGPVLVACSLGKDRTGLVVALLLSWLGVNRADVVADFVLSNPCLARGRHLLPARWQDPRRQIGQATGWVCAQMLDGIDADCYGVPSTAGIDAVRQTVLVVRRQTRLEANAP